MACILWALSPAKPNLAAGAALGEPSGGPSTASTLRNKNEGSREERRIGKGTSERNPRCSHPAPSAKQYCTSIFGAQLRTGIAPLALGSIEREQIVTDELLYRGHRLVVIEQPGGGSLVEITSLSGGQTIRTMTYQGRQEAIALAKQNIDKHPGG
ncbi:hypothetical protein [Bradyrhizobium embrapense]|uniref:hypothetical protein n=1 Tax=Bradyrhizobium embrapense TaxID=630921 RepID=UPI0012F4AE5D|nr:hypothetical protein [Bradyrhizobium embrapense]